LYPTNKGHRLNLSKPLRTQKSVSEVEQEPGSDEAG
jgi:hypothetical protein